MDRPAAPDLTSRPAPRRAPGLLSRLARDDAGAVTPFVAAAAVMVIGAVGFTLDAASYYTGNRKLRAATEAAALAAAVAPGGAASRAGAYFSSNGMDPSLIRSVEVGYYCADVGREAGARFMLSADLAGCPGGMRGPNAVRVTTSRPSQRFLSAVLGGANPIPDQSATATAARIDEAGIGITSGVLNVTNNLVLSVNGLLGALLGRSLNLTSGDVGALMNGQVDAGLFLDALARRTGRTGTYEDLVSSTAGIGDIAGAAADAATAGGDAATATALTTFAAQAGNGYTVQLSQLFGLGVWRHMKVGEADVKPALRAGINAYQLMAYAVRAGPGTIDASELVSLAVPNSTLRISALGSTPTDRPRFAFGAPGEAGASTDALRLQLQVGLDKSLVNTLTSVSTSVPVFVEVQPATADLVAIDCAGTDQQATQTDVTVRASASLVKIHIGTARAGTLDRAVISDSDFSPVDLAGINLLGLASVKATVLANIGPVSGNTQDLGFGPGEPGTVGRTVVPGGGYAAIAPVGVTMNDKFMIGSTLAGLVGPGLSVTAKSCLLSICTSAASTDQLSAVTGAIVNPVASLVTYGVDPLLDNVLAALGVQLGNATVFATGARCAVPVLV